MASVELRFSKYEGLGNDFIVVERDAVGRAIDTGEALRLCDRHRGIGADGVLETGLEGGRPFMRVTNADGSRPEMCGNGLRCVAAHLVSRGLVGEAFDVDTDAGPHRCIVNGHVIEVEMRAPGLAPADVPVRAEAPLIGAEWEFDGERLRVTAVSMGNPHVVTFDSVSDARRRELGPRMEKDPRFSKGANIGFAKLTGDDAIDLFVWERGAGWTEACGTGACAAAVAAVETGRVPRGQWVSVRLPGGVLEILVGDPGTRVRMRGPARHVFDGTVTL